MSIRFRDSTCDIVLDSIAFHAADFEIICIGFATVSEDQWQDGECSLMSGIAFRSVPGSVHQNRTKFQSCVVGDSKLPVG
jgi:hypothetical protein